MNSRLSIQIVTDGPGLAAGGCLVVTIILRATIDVGADTARRKATGWLVSEIGNLLVGGKPVAVFQPSS